MSDKHAPTCQRHPGARHTYNVLRGAVCAECAKEEPWAQKGEPFADVAYSVNDTLASGPAPIAYAGLGSQRFFELLREAWATHVKKGSDYGSDEDPLANFERAASICGWRPSEQALSLLATKVARLQRLNQKRRRGEAPANEAYSDTVRDLAAYCFLLLELLEREAAPDASA